MRAIKALVESSKRLSLYVIASSSTVRECEWMLVCPESCPLSECGVTLRAEEIVLENKLDYVLHTLLVTNEPKNE